MDKELIVELETENGYISYYKNDIVFVSTLESTGKIFEHDLVFDSLLEILQNSSVVIDGGAHAGSHTILYKNINPDLEVFAFEPQEKIFELLDYNVKKNNLANTHLYRVALGNKHTKVTMGTSVDDLIYDEDHEYVRSEDGSLLKNEYRNISYGDDNVFNLGGLGFGTGGEEVSVITIDSLNLKSLDFIKLDLEGAESLAIIGGIETIKRHRTIILFEHNHHQLSDDIYKELDVETTTTFELLESLGYEITSVGSDNFLAKNNA